MRLWGDLHRYEIITDHKWQFIWATWSKLQATTPAVGKAVDLQAQKSETVSLHVRWEGSKLKCCSIELLTGREALHKYEKKKGQRLEREKNRGREGVVQ